MSTKAHTGARLAVAPLRRWWLAARRAMVAAGGSVHCRPPLVLATIAASLLLGACADGGSAPVPSVTTHSIGLAADPTFEINVPGFDIWNRPYIRARNADSQGLIPGFVHVAARDGWERRSFFDAILAAYPQATAIVDTPSAGGFDPSHVAFDEDDHAYTVLRVGLSFPDGVDHKLLLLHSRDGGRQWDVHELPPDPGGNVFRNFVLERPHSPLPLQGPPGLLAYDSRGTQAGYQYGAYGDLYLIPLGKQADGTLALGAPVLIADKVLQQGYHSGGANRVLSDGDELYIVWAEATPEAIDPRGTPMHIAVYDRDDGTLAHPPAAHRPLIFGGPENDAHNMPGLVMDHDGHLHVVGGAHNDVLNYVRSTAPRSIAGFTASEPTLDPIVYPSGLSGGRGGQTYVALVRDRKSTLHLVYRRQINPVATREVLLLYQRKPKDQPWSAPIELARMPAGTSYGIFYHKLSIDRTERLYLTHSYYDNSASAPPPYTDSRILVSSDRGDSWRVATDADFRAGMHWQPRQVLSGDVDGDGRGDLVSLYRDARLRLRTDLSLGDGAYHTVLDAATDGTIVDQYPAHLGDIDGDGRADLTFVSRTVEGTLQLRTKRASGDGTWGESLGSSHTDGAKVHGYPTLMGDVNGDGLSDLVFLFRDPASGQLAIRTKLATGSGTFTASLQDLHGDGEGVHQYPTLLGDVDGDGKDDLVFVFRHWHTGALTLRTKLSLGDGSFSSTLIHTFTDGPGVHQYPALIGDLDGDGRDDVHFVFRHWADGRLHIRSKLSQGDGSWSESHTDFNDGPGVHQYATQASDTDADGQVDFVFPFRHWASDIFTLRTKLALASGGFDERQHAFADQP